ncbi:MAG: cysteine synthase A [Chloroflexi bacterium]|nr:cysteine synthase A [Chloroflexota bacterium]
MASLVVDSVLDLIGKTPLVRLRRMVKPGWATVLAKLESSNPGGSVKDRIALSMVEEAERSGKLKPGDTIVEPTSGNTGIGLALVAAVKGYRLVLTMPEDMTVERRTLLSLYGAEIVLTPAIEAMSGAIYAAEELVREHGYFMPQQFVNPANPEAHRRTTALEILEATDGQLDAFVAGVGTGGTISGVGAVLKERAPQVKVIAVEPARSAVLSGGRPGLHHIQGIGAGFIPGVVDQSVIDRVETVADEEAYEAARRMAREEGILAGPSSGASVSVALRVAAEMGEGKLVVAVLPDTGERYLSLMQPAK